MNKYLCLLGLCYCLLVTHSTSIAQKSVEYSKDTLHVAWGSDNYEGTTDISGKISVISDGKAIQMTIFSLGKIRFILIILKFG